MDEVSKGFEDLWREAGETIERPVEGEAAVEVTPGELVAILRNLLRQCAEDGLIAAENRDRLVAHADDFDGVFAQIPAERLREALEKLEGQEA